MRLRITTAVVEPAQNRFHALMTNGAFPEVAFSECVENGIVKWRSYDLLKYSLVRARFMKHLDSKMKESIDAELGIFTRKHSKLVLEKLNEILAGITEEDVRNHPERFNTWMD